VFYNARPVLNARITTKRTREENHNVSRENKKKKSEEGWHYEKHRDWQRQSF
jgi:ribosome assembly protein YihI (activator of Der GTPase)